jgi:transposase
MAYVSGTDRQQPMLFPECVEDYVNGDNPVRAIDLFVDRLELHELGMDCKQLGSVGRDGYDPKALLKLYLYGYLNKIRSSRGLERETKRNIEVIWLLGKLQPDHWTINNFRKQHSGAFKKVLRKFNLMCLSLGLFGAKLVAIDGAFTKAVNSKMRNYSPKRLKALLGKIDAVIAKFIEELEQSSRVEDCVAECAEEECATVEALAALREKRQRYEDLIEEAEQSATGQVSLSDPDSRLLNKGKQSVVGYNAQIAVDAEHHLIIASELTDAGNDMGQLSAMGRAAKEQLGVEELTVVADGGYHNLAEINRCEGDNIEVHAPEPAPRSTKKALYPVSSFQYDPGEDHYTCPNRQQLKRHADDRQGEVIYRKYYNAKACRDCPVREACTAGKYRKLAIHEHAGLRKKVAARMAATPEIYARRKGIVEHVFGTIKWDWGQGVFLTRGLKSTNGEWMLSCLAYNFRRVLNVLGTRNMIEAMG